MNPQRFDARPRFRCSNHRRRIAEMDLTVAATWNFVSQKRGLQPESHAFSPPPTIRPDSAGTGTFPRRFRHREGRPGARRVRPQRPDRPDPVPAMGDPRRRRRDDRRGIRRAGRRLNPADSQGNGPARGGRDRFRLRTGGGGFGPPLGRDPARVADDVAAGYISADHSG